MKKILAVLWFVLLALLIVGWVVFVSSWMTLLLIIVAVIVMVTAAKVCAWAWEVLTYED